MSAPSPPPSHLRVLPGRGRRGPDLVADDHKPLPLVPRVGFKLKVKWGKRWFEWTGWRVVRVNSRSFYVYGDGWTQRHLLKEWEDWLVERLDEGTVTILKEPAAPTLTVVGDIG